MRRSNWNDKIAVVGTKAFSSMGMFWLFCFWGGLVLVPGIPQGLKNVVLLTSSAFIQLAALPLISVGAKVLNRASDRQAKENHEMLHAEVCRLKAMDEKMDEILRLLKERPGV